MLDEEKIREEDAEMVILKTNSQVLEFSSSQIIFNFKEIKHGKK